jgi:hypothetical protein
MMNGQLESAAHRVLTSLLLRGELLLLISLAWLTAAVNARHNLTIRSQAPPYTSRMCSGV